MTAEVIGVARKFERSSELLDLLVESEGDSLREHNNYVRNNPENPTAFRHVASIMNALGYERPSEPPVLIPDEEVEQRVAEFRRELESRWTVCQDYLSSIAWPALRFRVTNAAQSFLTNVQVILTFHGAAGLAFESPEDFEWERLKDPDWEPPASDPYGIGLAQRFTPRVPAEYPVRWITTTMVTSK